MILIQDLLYLVFAASLVFAVVMVAKLQDTSPASDGAEDDGRVIVIPELFFSAKGRIGRGDYWIGAAAILASVALDAAAPPAGVLMWLSSLIWLVMFYSAICLYAKRLHDLGLSGWLQLFLYAAGLVFVLIGIAMIVPQAIKVAMEHPKDPAGVQAAMKALPKPTAWVAYGYGVVKVLFTIGLGLPPSRQEKDPHGQASEPGMPEFA